jgi:hypothetical protein
MQFPRGAKTFTEKQSHSPGAVMSSVQVGFDVLTAVTMKNTLFWDLTPFSLVVHRHFLRDIGEPLPECTALHSEDSAIDSLLYITIFFLNAFIINNHNRHYLFFSF